MTSHEDTRQMVPVNLLIRMRRNARGMTQEGLARKLDVATRTVIRWENRAGTPDDAHRVALAQVLGGASDDYGTPSSEAGPSALQLAEQLRHANRELADLRMALAAAVEMIEEHRDLAQRLTDLEALVQATNVKNGARPREATPKPRSEEVVS